MHMPESLRPGFVRQYTRYGHLVLELHGEIDISAAIESAALLDEITAQHGIKLIVDLTPIQFLDCAGLDLLCRAQQRVLERNGTWLLICPHPLTLRLMRMTRLTERLHPEPTLEHALTAQG